MTNKDVVTVSKRDGTLVETLTSLISSSFNVSWENNSTYQITFTAFDDKSVSYALLLSENIITWRGQQFVIKQCVPNFSGNYNTVAITATHIYLDVRRIFQHNKKAGTLTYSVKDVLAFYFDKSPFGYSYEVSGDFSKQQITDLGGNNAFEGLSQIVSTWKDVVIYPDNKKITIYTKDSFSKNLGNRLGYGHNADNMTLTYDSTGLINQLTVVSTNKDDGKPYFQSHIIKDDASIKEYGVWDGGDFSDERYHDSNNADTAARAKFVTQPSVSVTLDYLDNDIPVPGELRRLEIIDTGFVTNVMVVAYNYYPLDDSLKTSITLNSNAKTVLDFQRSNRNQLYQSKQNTAALSAAIQETNDQIEKIILNQPKSWVVGKIEG
ncbi:prophage endopeptidase tail family protein [Leuconostoc citreum]|uniref:prophage endopeptidase tail family protein n=1 Tax=Leuconostoc citreum TaxID=33964 RepID=UPI0015DADC9E|nr:prophage endopeptidase tail family protein [Leuconostoc citreum]